MVTTAGMVRLAERRGVPDDAPKCVAAGRPINWLRVLGTAELAQVKPTVSPAKNSLVYFISTAYIDHPGWRSHCEEAKRGAPSGPCITRNEGAMLSLLL